MTNPLPQDGSKSQTVGGAPARRAWVKPVLVEYGHLAKLTRGGSGIITEPGGKKKMCL
jgi:hypothetical protein